MIAALFVETGGVYFGLPNVDPWDIKRDARLYAGPHPVVAHPPCERWGRYWSGGPSAKERRAKGDDGGCFASALAAVNRFGGVLEHPEASHAWTHFELPKPPKTGHWLLGGTINSALCPFTNGARFWTCCVEQGHYGHRARKATWLYYVSLSDPPDLIWGPSTGERLDAGFHSVAERKAAGGQAAVIKGRRLVKSENVSTPLPFRNLLWDLARTARAS